MNIEQLRQQIDKQPRFRLAHRPTPLEPLSRFSKAVGGPTIYMKRDDCTGFAMGGNKARHNEFVMAEALSRGADLFVWGGLIQSNNCRQTAAACAKAGLDCHLVLTGPPRDEPVPLEGNFLLDNLFGASYEIVDAGMGKDLNRRIIDAATRFQDQGRKVFRWDRHVVTPLAAISYVECAAEIFEQSTAAGFVPAAIYVSSSGSTGAGLTLGCRALGQTSPVRNVAYVRWEWDIPSDMADIANEVSKKLDLGTQLAPSDIDVTLDYIAPGYGKLTEAVFDAISLLARTEGILLDPVYTGKAMSALLDDVRRGRLTPQDHVVFVHTGGTPALFAYGRELGEQLAGRKATPREISRA
ncbi:MAG TPA: D-cysteine desulfhydrase family protein [Planctomycetaceae bacterium]|jgi:L-cysteate sulfo-lyase|nr:D-cysteine desulfhydrase family protein [Planctomycetaceae bacterium]